MGNVPFPKTYESFKMALTVCQMHTGTVSYIVPTRSTLSEPTQKQLKEKYRKSLLECSPEVSSQVGQTNWCHGICISSRRLHFGGSCSHWTFLSASQIAVKLNFQLLGVLLVVSNFFSMFLLLKLPPFILPYFNSFTLQFEFRHLPLEIALI